MNRSRHGRSIPLVPVIVFSFLWLLATVAVAAGPVVIDHTCTDLNKIPESAISQAKADLHIAYGHTSHGSQLISGMGDNGTDLDQFLTNSPNYSITPGLYVWNEGGEEGALDIDDWAMQGDAGQYPTWVDNTRTYLGDPDPATGRGDAHPAVNVIIWSWCGQVSTITAQSMIDTYLAPMTQLELDYPGVTFVYMTGHLDGTGETENLHLRNEQIRDYCRTNDKILYDFADIESYDPDGLVHYMPLIALDNCAYDSDGNGTRDRNWAIDWQDSHVEGVDWWASGASHSQHLNGNLKGYAAWWLWAVLGGWNPCLSVPPGLAADGDQDGVHDSCDNCPGQPNPLQFDCDQDGLGDACDPDVQDGDGDGIDDACDNCLGLHNTDQKNTDGDVWGDSCDDCTDTDHDGYGDPGFPNACPEDVCPYIHDPDQMDNDGDRHGFACDCDDFALEIYPDAPEVNDGIDNQCPGDEGYGIVDEMGGNCSFHNSTTEYSCEPPQQLYATSYEIARSELSELAAACTIVTDTIPYLNDPESPPTAACYSYLTRPLTPHEGSWGQNSSGAERIVACP